jgi:hypothetical protein
MFFWPRDRKQVCKDAMPLPAAAVEEGWHYNDSFLLQLGISKTHARERPLKRLAFPAFGHGRGRISD